ncbi:MAG: hypothetical protein ACLUWN_01230 [Clostridia bacterium]|jgi:hypothetical protein|nr:MAG TPA: hypothetical protein [Caudoviricetes sp.]
MDIEEDIKILEKFKNNEMQRDKLERDNRCGGWKIGDIYKKLELDIAIEHILAEREEDKKKINKLEYCVEELKKYNKTISDRVVEYKKNRIPKQKVINSINYYDERIKHAKLIKDKEQEELYIYIKRAFYKLLEDK